MNDKELPRQTAPRSQPCHWENNAVCPHWEATSRACLVIKAGLFLPIEQHVTNYCLSSHYPSCRYYEVPDAIVAAEHPQPPEPNDHRRSNRTPSRNTFRYFELSRDNQPTGRHESDAWTIDLSEHGVCFATRELLNIETTLNFSLEVNEARTLIEGTGRVIWSKPLENTPLFHTGMAFTKRMVSSIRPQHP